jgi:hypothetical protein
MTAGLHTVHVRVTDAATGKPTPCRIRLTDAVGNYYPPLGRLSHFAAGRGQDVGGNLLLGDKQYAYIDGACEVPLPAGTIRAELWKGPEYRPQTVEVSLPAGKLALRLSIERWTNLRERGWYSGDTRCHFMSPHASVLEAAGEDLALVELLAGEWRIADWTWHSVPAVANITAFSGQLPALERPGHLVAVNTYNTHPWLGELALLNCHRAVYPLTFGGTEGWDDWTMAAWCDQCHRKGGLVVWPAPAHDPTDWPLGEPLADLILGKVDAFEITSSQESPYDSFSDWYPLLNCGFHVPLVGASGKASNAVALGGMRTYARLQAGEAFSQKSWIEAIRAGRTFVTNGPLVTLTAAGKEPGEVLDLETAGQKVHLRAEASSIVPFESLEIVAGSNVIASAAAVGTTNVAVVDAEVAVPPCLWLAARCRGRHRLCLGTGCQNVWAHTSPVYVRQADQPHLVDQKAVARFTRDIGEMLQWVANRARCPTEKHRADLANVFTAAREELLRRMAWWRERG